MKRHYLNRLVVISTILSLFMSVPVFASIEGKEIKSTKKVETTTKEEGTDNTYNENGVRIIDFDEALKLAEKNNSSLKTLVESLEIMEDQKQKLSEQYATLSPDATGALNAVEVNFIKSIDSLTTNINNSENSKELIKEATTLSVMSLFDNFYKVEKELNIAQKNYEIAKTETPKYRKTSKTWS